jgi:hypothetical protein
LSVGGCQGVQAVLGELGDWDVAADLARAGALSYQLTDELNESLMGSHHVLTLVKGSAQVTPAAVAPGQMRVSSEDLTEAFTRVSRFVSDGNQPLEVAGNLPLVPSGQNGVNVGEVLVQRGPADAGRLRDAGHRHAG